jgi:hypothetical protein
MNQRSCSRLSFFAVLSGLLCMAGQAQAAGSGAWPGDSYSGPLTAVSGTLGSATVPIFNYGAYPAAGSMWRYKTDFTAASLATFITANGDSWRAENFDDTAWPQGALQIGYGDAVRDEVTLVARTDYSTVTAPARR